MVAGGEPRAATGDVVLRTVTDPEEFRSLQPEWDRLVCAMRRPSPFLLHGWVAPWLDHYGSGGSLLVEAAFREERLVAAAPFFVGRSRGARVLEFLGGHRSALADLLLAADEDTQLLTRLMDRVLGAAFDCADLFGAPEGSRLEAVLGPRLAMVERIEAPVLDISSGWDAVYRERTSAKRRNLHRRRVRQLARLGTLEFVTARDPPELEAALEDAFRLHDLRWQGRPDRAEFTDSAKAFHRAVIGALAGRDVARIVLLRLNGTAIAFHYFFALAGRMYVHRLAFDPEFARFSPGLLTTFAAIEHAEAEGLREVEFLGGDERYKVELADRSAPLYQGLGLARTYRGRALTTARLLSLQLRRRLKRSSLIRRVYMRGSSPLGPAGDA